MKMGILMSRHGETPVWKYERESGDFLVKEITIGDESYDYVIETPDVRFYFFPADLQKDVLELLSMVESNNKLIEKYIDHERNSIYDE